MRRIHVFEHLEGHGAPQDLTRINLGKNILEANEEVAHEVYHYVTSQCHNYALENDFGDDIFITHININDNTVEGFKHKHHPVLGVQYHPKAILGQDDSSYIFDEFIKMMDNL